MNSSPFHIALTGITGYSASYLDVFKKISKHVSMLRAVTAINRSEHEATCAEIEAEGIDVFTDYPQMLEEWGNRIDLCVLPVPIHLHVSMTLDALNAGMNVLLEKPMAGSVEQGKRLCEKDPLKRRIAIGFQDMYRPSTYAIARDLKHGRIGKITGVRMLALWPRGAGYYNRNQWAGAVEVDGHVVRDSPINNATAHFVNLALFFAGTGSNRMARAETLQAELFRCRDIQSFDTAAIRVLTDTGIPLHLYATHSGKEQGTARVSVDGEHGTMTWVQGEYVKWETEKGEEISVIETTEDCKIHMWESVLLSLQSGEDFLCTPDMAMAHVELVEKVHLEHKIQDVDDVFLIRDGEQGNIHTRISGMDSDFKNCYARKALPSELGCPWAVSI